jgi:hypothetical protein
MNGNEGLKSVFEIRQIRIESEPVPTYTSNVGQARIVLICSSEYTDRLRCILWLGLRLLTSS